jgi:hypothetical protein
MVRIQQFTKSISLGTGMVRSLERINLAAHITLIERKLNPWDLDKKILRKTIK